jgi:hypothetical protein
MGFTAISEQQGPAVGGGGRRGEWGVGIGGEGWSQGIT